MTKVFIDGSAGTTGLRIYERLAARKELSLITLSEEKRKDTEARRDALNEADVAFLCLPDAAAREAIGLVENDRTVVIDTSTAHRTQAGWTYGFPELSIGREAIRSAKRIANPGCHASGFLALVEPLVASGLLDKSEALSAFSITGYSGGGKKMIAEYENASRSALLDAPRQYGLTQQHKHLKEMATIAGLELLPLFSPIVAPFYSGMEVSVPLFTHQLNCEKTKALAEVAALYQKTFCGPVVRFNFTADEEGFLSAGRFSGKDSMEIALFGNEERLLLVSRFDNLGKGASGAAIQNMNLVLGLDETAGLVLE